MNGKLGAYSRSIMAEMKITLFAAYSCLLSVGRVTLPAVNRWSHMSGCLAKSSLIQRGRPDLPSWQIWGLWAHLEFCVWQPKQNINRFHLTGLVIFGNKTGGRK